MPKAQDYIKIRGARVHNLKGINVDIPKNKLVVIAGVSGSGKSSLAFDTLYAEGQRRYVESLSSYARQFLGVMQKPEVDKIEGISPAIAIDQRKASHNPRSTVGTTTEIYDYLRVLFARVGVPHCPKCGRKVARQTIDQIVEQILNPVRNFNKQSKKSKPNNRKISNGVKLPRSKEILILGPLVRARKGEHKAVLAEVEKAGFVRARVDGVVQRLEEALARELDPKKKHNIEVVVDRLVLGKGLDRARLVDSLEIALRLGKGRVIVSRQMAAKPPLMGPVSSKVNRFGENTLNATPKRNGPRYPNRKTQDNLIFSEHFACEHCGVSLPEIEPRLFSFYSPFGACPTCQGLGHKLEVAPNLVLPNKNLSIAQGAIVPWARASHKVGRQSWFWRILQRAAQQHNFSLYEPVKNLPKQAIDILLFGDPEPKQAPRNNKPRRITLRGKLYAGQARFGASDGLAPRRPERQPGTGAGFEGVIPNLERRYWQTDSEAVRDEIKKYMRERKCEACEGRRLKPEALAVKIAGKSIDALVNMSISQAKDFLGTDLCLAGADKKIAQGLLKEIIERLGFLIDVGLDYLTLSRQTGSLSGGEEQRTRLATQIGSKLTGVLYILDEPSIGLHPRDQARLIKTLKGLRDVGNTVLVVEHDPATVKSADYVVEIGPGAGKHGGRVVFTGAARSLLKSHTLTGEYLSGRLKVALGGYGNEARIGYVKGLRKEMLNLTAKPNGLPNPNRRTAYLEIKGAKEHNLKNIDVKIPLANFVCVTGVSGSGKSSLVNDIIARALAKRFYRAKEEPGRHKAILGAENLDKVVLVDQSPIGRTPRSNPATYTGAFTYIRQLFSQTREAKIRGFSPGRFSFNVKGGRCEACEGQGQKKIEMYFLPDVYVVCEECKGKRYNRETLEINYNSKNIAEVLAMTVEEAKEFFKNIPSLHNKLDTLYQVGLGYLELGQSAPSLSGGEAQRVKLSAELSKKPLVSSRFLGQKTLYILDEPTTGLHPHDIKKLLFVLKELVRRGNTVLAIEHNLDFIRGGADWLIDLGPEGGDKGGYIIAQGVLQDIAKSKTSQTAKYLKN